MKRRRKFLIAVLLCYLVFDLRPLLLIPNLILYHFPCGKYSRGNGAMELKVFPRLCVAGDPIWAVISSHDLPLGSDFARTYDRSGLFGSLQFSTATNSPNPVDTLYWTRGICGGLGGTEPNHTEKTIWLEDYVRFDGAGRYRLNFRYEDYTDTPNSQKPNYDLGDFSIINLPENPVSKFLKQVVLAVMLLVPSNEVREMAAKGLGYQETAYATYILAHYLSAYADEWGHEYNNSLASAGRGILRNYDYRTVGHILKPMADTTTRDLLHEYFRCHFYRMLFPELEPGSRFSPDEQRQRVAKVISEMSRCLGDTINDEIRGYLEAQLREITDDHFQKQIELCDEKLRTTTKDDEKKKWAKARAWAVEELANRERQVPIERITAALQLLGPNRGTTNVPPSAAR